MKTAYPNLAAEMARRNMDTTELARFLEVSYNTAYKRLRGDTTWKLSEVSALCALLGEPDVNILFLRLDTN